ncbi:hypothetical protein ACS0TY_018613 [Phlomoides rotata]
MHTFVFWIVHSILQCFGFSIVRFFGCFRMLLFRPRKDLAVDDGDVAKFTDAVKVFDIITEVVLDPLAMGVETLN